MSSVISFTLDVIIIAVCVITVILGYKKGFFKSVMTLCSGIAAVFVAYAFTPQLSLILKEKFILNKLAGGITETLASMAKDGTDAAGNVIYDLTKLSGNTQFSDILQQYGAGSDSVDKVIEGTSGTGSAVIEKVATAIADPAASTLSGVLAFVLLFIGALIALKIITSVVGLLFKMPVLKTLDKFFGLVFGVAAAFLFICVFTLLADGILQALNSIAPDVFGEKVFNNSILLKFFAEHNVLEMINNVLN